MHTYPASHISFTDQFATTRIAINYTKSLRYLLDCGADPDLVSNPRSVKAQSATSCAATHSDTTALAMLFECGASLDPEAIFHAIGGFRHEETG